MTQNALLILTLLSVFFLSVVGLIRLIPVLEKKKMGQHILEAGPKWHKDKEGTPTMGGIAPAFAIVLVCFGMLLIPYTFDKETKAGVILTLLYGIACAGIGIVDDLTKYRHNQNQGLTPWQKLILQIAFSAAYLALLYLYGWIDTALLLPFTTVYLELGFWFYPLALFFLVGTINFANLTDGVDGLASSVNFMIGGCFVYFGMRFYSKGLLLVAAALMAGALAFLLFNYHPARIFMGDTGSLFFGGLAVGCAFLSKMPLLICFAGIVYFLEGLSVVLQVCYYKLTHGKRLLKMAPFHHHLEKTGWNEEKIVYVLTVLSLFGAVLGGFAYA